MFLAASVCLFVCQHDNFRTSKHRMMKLGGRCSVQKSRPSSTFGVIAPPLGPYPPKMWVGLRRWENQHRLSTCSRRQTKRHYACTLYTSTSMVFTARRYASAVLAVIVCPSVCPSVRPSVCPSVTSRSCTKMVKPRIRLTTPYDSPETLVLRCQKSWRNSNDMTPNGGAK